MKVIENFTSIAISMLFLTGLTACDQPGPAETAGKKIDQTAGDASKKISEAADKIGKKLEEQGEKASMTIDDAEITTKIKAAIFTEPGLKTLQISVDTIKGVVTLSGSVDSLPSSDRVKALAGAVAGVKEVKNQLVIK